MIKRVSKRIGDQEFAVIGLGRFGRALALRLEETGHSVLGIDIDRGVVQRIADDLTAAVVLDATDEGALDAAGIKDFNTVIVALGGVFEAAALCVAALKGMEVPNVIVQASSDQHRQLLLRIGADRVVQPLQAGGRRLAEELAFPLLLRELSVGPDYIIAEISPPAKFIHKHLSELDLRDAYSINVLLIKRGKELLVSPSAETELLAGDILVVLGPKEKVLQLVDHP
jgi:trk system potassium uptake protein TrkA